MRSNRRREAAAAAVAISCAWGLAAAQSGVEGAGDGSGRLEEVIVSGEKMERSVQDTPTSVSVTTAERIEKETIRNFFDIVNRTANLSETYGESGFTIRGISNSSVTAGGNGGLATVYVDGVALPRQGVYGGPLNMWDVEQVEILRGPQSTLQGRNALAGAVMVTSRAPTRDWGFRGRTIATDYDDRSVALAGGGPLVNDELAFRIAVEDRDSDGFIYNPTRDEHADAVDFTNARGKLLWEPAGIAGLSVLASYTANERESGYRYTYSRIDVPDFYDNRLDLSNAPNEMINQTDMATLDVGYEISGRLSFTSLTAVGRVEESNRYDGDLTAESISDGESLRDTDTRTQEFRVNFRGERLDGLLGVYLSHRDIESTTESLTLVQTPVSTLVGVLQGPPFGLDAQTAELAANAYTGALPEIPVNYTSDAPQEVDTVALFADGEVELAPRLSLLAGFRYDVEEYTITSEQSAVFAGTYPEPAAFGELAPVVSGLNLVVEGFVGQASASAPRTTREFDAFLPKLGLTYDWTEDLSTSFIVQRGYRSGGSQINVTRSTIVPFDPEYTRNYEFSVRSLWLDGAMSVNANVFHTDWTDQQVSVNLGLNAYDNQTENAGQSKLHGFELELAHEVSERFDWYASLGHTQTEFEEFTVDTGDVVNDLSGTEFAFAPEWTVGAGASYRWTNGVFLNLNASHRDDAFAATGADQARYAIDARTLVNAKIGYEDDRWGAYVFSNNLLDEEYMRYPRRDDGIALLGDPRVLGLVVEASW